MTDPADRLFDLLPAVVRAHDTARGHPLRELLHVIGAEAVLLEDEIRRMYENLFVETAEPWAVPYLGDLVGYRPLFVPPGPDGSCDGDRRARLLNPRRAVAEHLGLTRRKGTLSVLEEVVAAASGWPAEVDDSPVEGPDGASTVSIRVRRLPSWPLTRVRPYYLPRRTNCFALGVLGNDTPLFTRADPAPTADEEPGPWRGPAPITRETPKAEYYGPDRSLVLYEDDHPVDPDRIVVQDLTDWVPEVHEDRVALDPERGRVMFPERHRPRRFTASYHYGFPADMGGGEYPRPLAGATATSSLFRPGHLLRVTDAKPEGYVLRLQERLHTGQDRFTEGLRGLLEDPTVLAPSEDNSDPELVERRLGAQLNRILQAHSLADGPLDDGLDLGEEATALRALRPRGPRRIRLNRLVLEAVYEEEIARSYALVRVTSHPDTQVIMDAVRAVRDSRRPTMSLVVELADSGLYVEPVVLDLPPHHALELRAAEGCRPTIVLPERGADIDDMVITCGHDTRVVLDGLSVSRHAVRVAGNPTSVDVRHCTFVPGWELDSDCEPCCGEEPSLIVTDVPPHPSGNPAHGRGGPAEPLAPTRVRVERSIVGTVLIQRDEVAADPLRLEICRSVVDATEDDHVAVAAPNDRYAHAVVSVVGSTVRGVVLAHALELGENSIFTGPVRVARRQVGCLRFSWVPPGSRTPRRHACQPDLALAALESPGKRNRAAAVAAAAPVFLDDPLRYGKPDYCRLHDDCPDTVRRGADDESEMGVWHDLYHPQRQDSMAAAVVDFLPLGWRSRQVFES